MEMLRKNKVFLIDTLSTDSSIVLQHVQSDNIITKRDYKNLNQPNYTGEKIIINLLDNVMGKGDETCQKLLKLLEKEDLQEIFPQLKELSTTHQTSHQPSQQTSHQTSHQPSQQTSQQQSLGSKGRVKDTEEISEYKMSSRPRGVCLIINNMDFGHPDMYRHGSDMDEEALIKVFKWLGFTPEVHRNQTAEQMKTILSTNSRKQHEGDCFVCCILSHGTTDGVYGTDEEIVSGSDIYEVFNGTFCPSLINKPKVFFIQACRGTQHQLLVKVQVDGHSAEKAGGKTEEEEELEADAVQITIPAEADFLVARSTVKGFYSFRGTSGSWFIQSLCEQLNKHCQRGEDIYSILLRVNEEVSKKVGVHDQCKVKQMPVQKFTLRKKLVFRVPQ